MEAEHDQHRRAGIRVCSSLHQPGAAVRGYDLPVSAISEVGWAWIVAGALWMCAVAVAWSMLKGRRP
jgi:hypothetical protein